MAIRIACRALIRSAEFALERIGPERQIGINEGIGADELVVAGKRVAELLRAAIAELAPVGAAGVVDAIIGQGRMLGPDARVEDANDDAFAGRRRVADLRPCLRGADEVRSCIGQGLLEPVLLYGNDAVDREQRADLVCRDDAGDAAVGDLE